MFRRNLISLLVVTTLSLTLPGCGEENTADPRTSAPLVRTAQVQPASMPTRTFTGVIAARVQSNLGFRVGGKIKQRLVDTGQVVKRGQVLLRLDPADLQLAAAAQQETVAAARALATQTADDESRLRGLKGTGAISASAYDRAKAAADSALAQLKAVEAQARVAANSSLYTELLADADGIIMDTLAEPGQVVSAGQPVVLLAQQGPREAMIQLPETLRPAIGMAAEATLYGSSANRTKARLRQLSAAADPLTRTFAARFVLDGELAEAPLGSTVTIRFAEPGQSDSAMQQVPVTALYDQGRGAGVWVVTGTPAKVSWQAVTVQQLGSEHAMINASLSPDTVIVTLGTHLLHEGQPVRLSDSAGAATGAAL